MRIELIEEDAWDKYFQEVNLKNISQDWNYGTVKSRINNVLTLRYKITDNESVTAIFQLYIKRVKYFPLIKLCYLNRGPLFVIEPTAELTTKVFKAIKYYFRWQSGYVLLLNPFIDNSIENEGILRKLKYRRLGKNEYSTAYVDLLLSEDDLRKKLNSKWRNQLSLSERKGVTVEVNLAEDYIKIILQKYKMMTSEKNFYGLSENEILTLYDNFSKRSQFINLIAYDCEGLIVAFSIVLCYGDQAVYLIGWVDNNARRLNPSNLLLWSAIKYLKLNGYKIFDLGGLDEQNLPGITKFKKGISGKEVSYTERWINI